MFSLVALLWPLFLVSCCAAFPSSFFEHSPPTTRASAFDPSAQYIDVTGPHAYEAPGPNDMRGPCPGLNSLANHKFIPHNGIVSLTQSIAVSEAVYGLEVDTATIAAGLGLLYGGNVVTLDSSYSIGGPPPANLLGGILGGLLGTASGLSYTHNKFESDSSATRGDYDQFNGNAYDLQLDFFTELYGLQPESPIANYDRDIIFAHRLARFEQSVQGNPFFFYGPVQMAVSCLTHFLIPGLMSNHSVENPDGVLSNDALKSFYGVSKSTTGALIYTPGTERIPGKWYRRPIGDEYGAVHVATDLVAMISYDPRLVVVGGNINGVNTYAPLDIAAFTHGVYSAEALLQGDNAACFVLQALTLLFAAGLNGVEGLVLELVEQVDDAVGGLLSGLLCPQLTSIDQSMLEQYPGYKKPN